MNLRGPFLLFWTAVGIAGFAILVHESRSDGDSPWVSYAGAVVGAVGAVAPVPASLAWAGNNMAGDLKRGELTMIISSSFSTEYVERTITAVGIAIVLGGANVFGYGLIAHLVHFENVNGIRPTGSSLHSRIGAHMRIFGSTSRILTYIQSV
jgi:hypothetical protein